MSSDKFDNMMKSYCNREVESFEFVKKKSTIKRTSLIAATLVLVFLAVIVFSPRNVTNTDEKENSFTLTASAAEIECTVEEIFSKTPFIIEGDNIEKICAYSKDLNTSIAFGADKNYNLTDKYHYENITHSPDTPDPLFVVPYIVDKNGELKEADLSTDIAQETPYTYVEVVDENKTINHKRIPVVCIAIDENKEYLSPENFSSKYNDTIVVEVTFTNGEKQTKTATIEYEGTKMLIDTSK